MKQFRANRRFTLVSLALLGLIYASLSMIFTLNFRLSPAAITLMHHVDRAFAIPVARIVLGQLWYGVLLIPISAALAFLRTGCVLTFAALIFYGIVMMLIQIQLLHMWWRLAIPGALALEILPVIVSVILQLPLWALVRLIASLRR